MTTHPCIRYALVIAILLCFQTLAANAGIYSWTDKNGVKHFSNEPPPSGETADRQEEIRYEADQYKKWDQARQSKQDKMLEADETETDGSKKPSASNKKAIKTPGKVEMYVTPTCGYCKRARAFFKKHDIAFAEYDVKSDKQAAKRFKELKGNGVPLIFVGDRRISGFNKPLMRKLFGIKPAAAKP